MYNFFFENLCEIIKKIRSQKKQVLIMQNIKTKNSMVLNFKSTDYIIINFAMHKFLTNESE